MPATINTVVVRRRCNAAKRAIFRLDDIGGLHMYEFTAGETALHGYVWCDALLEGALDHECARGSGAHRIKVCVLPDDNRTQVYQALMDRMREAL